MSSDLIRKSIERAMYTSVFYTPENLLKAYIGYWYISQPEVVYTLVINEGNSEGVQFLRNTIDSQFEKQKYIQKIVRRITLPGYFLMLFLGPPAVAIVASFISDATRGDYPTVYAVCRSIHRFIIGNGDPSYLPVLHPNTLLAILSAYSYGKMVDDKVRSTGKNKNEAMKKCGECR